jgi:hypothetical protein
MQQSFITRYCANFQLATVPITTLLLPQSLSRYCAKENEIGILYLTRTNCLF